MTCFKKILLASLMFCTLAGSALAETITLTSGQIIKGTVVEQTDEYIRVDMGIGVPLTFFRTRIKSIVEDTVESIEPIPVRSAAISPFQNEKSFLWQVHSDTTTVYIFGSVHLGKPEMYPMKPAIEGAFEESDVLVVEVNTNAIPNNVAQRKMLGRGMYPQGNSLSQNLPESVSKKLSKYLFEHNLSLLQFNAFKPWFVGLTLTVLQVKQLGFDEQYGVDMYFLKKAEESQKAINELETLDQQLEFLDTIPNQSRFLEYSLYSLAETERMLTALLQAWNTGDVRTMERIMITEILNKHPELEPIYEKILYERNDMMVEKIERYLQNGQTYFVTVGAGHLIGPRGLVQQLQKKGFKVEQL